MRQGRHKQHAYTKKNLGSLTLTVVIILACFVCTGCNESNEDQAVVEQVRTPGDLRKARLQSELNQKFESPRAHYELGSIYQDQGLWAKALYHYNTALTFDPVHRDAQAAVVKTLIASGDNAKAKLSADIYMDQASGSATESVKLALAFQRQRLDEHALTAFKQALQLAPNSAKVNRQIGYYYLSKDNTQLATEYLSRSFQLNPNQPDVAGELGRLGVEVRIPRKQAANPKKVDKIVEDSTAQQ